MAKKVKTTGGQDLKRNLLVIEDLGVERIRLYAGGELLDGLLELGQHLGRRRLGRNLDRVAPEVTDPPRAN